VLAKSQKPGKSISQKAEILNISKFGIWLLVNHKEYFLPFTEYPWFEKASVHQIYNVQTIRGKNLHWPDLDIDLEMHSLENLEKYPLKYK
jgi:hypothetical protein